MDTMSEFLKASTAGRLRMAADASLEAALLGLLGQAGLDDYRRLAGSTDSSHLSIEHATNLVFVPGVTGSLLRSRTMGGVWWLDLRSLNRLNNLRLQSDGLHDASAGDAIVPFAVDTTYEPFLTAVLNHPDFGHEVFPYDWRKPLAASTDALRDLIEATYAHNGHQPVHLVAHSMGGLLVRHTLMQHDALWSRVGRIVFIGTPHYGSQSIGGYLKNHLWGFDEMALLGKYLSRETFRSMWGALSLLPAPRGLYPGTRPDDADPWRHDGLPYAHPCANFDIYDAAAWQLDLSPAQASALQVILDAAAQMHRDLDSWHGTLPPAKRARMLMIAGVGYQTLFRLEYEDVAFGLWERMAKVTGRRPGDRHRDGDGRVPLASALLPDIETRYVRGVHAGLTNIPQVYDDVFRWLAEETLRLADDPDAALSQHLADDESASAAPALDGTDRAQPFSDDPGYLDLRAVDSSELERLDAELEQGRLPDFQRLKLL